MEMVKREKTAIRIEVALKMTTSKVYAYHLTCDLITSNSIPRATICAIYPGIRLRIRMNSMIFITMQ